MAAAYTTGKRSRNNNKADTNVKEIMSEILGKCRVILLCNKILGECAVQSVDEFKSEIEMKSSKKIHPYSAL